MNDSRSWLPSRLLVVGFALLAAGAMRHYQVWYRDAAAFCTMSTFNSTNGLTIDRSA